MAIGIQQALWYAQIDASLWGKKSLKYSHAKTEGTYRSGEGGEEPAQWPRIWITSTCREGREYKAVCEYNRRGEHMY